MNKKSDKTPKNKPNSDSEIFEQQKLERFTDGFTVPSNEIPTLHQSPSEQSAIKLNQLKQLQKIDDPQKQPSEESKNQFGKSHDALSSQSEQDSERAKYNRLAELTTAESGKIGQLRLDMEIYYRATLESDKTKVEGKRILKQSSKYRQLKKQDPKLAKRYLNAIANSAPVYKRLPKKTKNLDSVAERLVSYDLGKQLENNKIGSSPQKIKSQEGQQLERYRKLENS